VREKELQELERIAPLTFREVIGDAASEMLKPFMTC
jgi:hypothetical protein